MSQLQTKRETEDEVVCFRKNIIKKNFFISMNDSNDFLISRNESESLCPDGAVVPELFSRTAQKQGRWLGWDIFLV